MARNEIRGMQQTLRELRKFNPDLLKELKKDLTKQAQPIFTATAARMPEVAASHWGSKGRTGYSRARAAGGLKVSIRAAKRVKGIRGSYASINLTQSNAGGAIWDQAGSRGKYQPPRQRGIAFDAALNRSTGRKAQRGLWPSVVAQRSKIEMNFRLSIDRTARIVNLRMQQRI
jgi:hypothetical protein